VNTTGSGVQMQTSGAVDHFWEFVKGVGWTKEESGHKGHEDSKDNSNSEHYVFECSLL